MLFILRKLELYSEKHATNDKILCLIIILPFFLVCYHFVRNECAGCLAIVSAFLRFNLKAAAYCGIFPRVKIVVVEHK